MDPSAASSEVRRATLASMLDPFRPALADRGRRLRRRGLRNRRRLGRLGHLRGRGFLGRRGGYGLGRNLDPELLLDALQLGIGIRQLLLERFHPLGLFIDLGLQRLGLGRRDLRRLGESAEDDRQSRGDAGGPERHAGMQINFHP